MKQEILLIKRVLNIVINIKCVLNIETSLKNMCSLVS